MIRAAETPHTDESIDLSAVAAYFDGEEFREAVSRPEFETRCAELFRRFDAGALMTIADAAAFVGLRWDAFAVAMIWFAPSYLPATPGRGFVQ
jgi:hypothetical protein